MNTDGRPRILLMWRAWIDLHIIHIRKDTSAIFPLLKLGSRNSSYVCVQFHGFIELVEGGLQYVRFSNTQMRASVRLQTLEKNGIRTHYPS